MKRQTDGSSAIGAPELSRRAVLGSAGAAGMLAVLAQAGCGAGSKADFVGGRPFFGELGMADSGTNLYRCTNNDFTDLFDLRDIGNAIGSVVPAPVSDTAAGVLDTVGYLPSHFPLTAAGAGTFVAGGLGGTAGGAGTALPLVTGTLMLAILCLRRRLLVGLFRRLTVPLRGPWGGAQSRPGVGSTDEGTSTTSKDSC